MAIGSVLFIEQSFYKLEHMHLNDKGEVYKHCCMVWNDPNEELWIPDDTGRIGIYCMEHDQVLLGYEDEIPEKI